MAFLLLGAEIERITFRFSRFQPPKKKNDYTYSGDKDKNSLKKKGCLTKCFEGIDGTPDA